MLTIGTYNQPTYDVVVVGCGGWGLAVLKVLWDIGLDVLGLERGEICHNLTTYMPQMTVHSPLPYIVLDPGDPLLAAKGDNYHSTIEELIQGYLDFAAKYSLPIKTHCELCDIQGTQGDFSLSVRDQENDTSHYQARLVVLATGSYDTPNLLDIPGEQDPAVHHYFAAWQHIRNQRLLFIGGGFSSADGITALCPHNQILWVTQKPLDAIEKILHDQRTKWGQPDAKLLNTEILPESQVRSLAVSKMGAARSNAAPRTALIQTPDGERQWPFDQCFMLLGHRPDEPLLQRVLGDDTSHDESTFESQTRPGLYLVGALAKKNLEHIGLTNKLCPGNEDIRHITKVIEAIKTQLNATPTTNHQGHKNPLRRTK
jgi:thioredoxin reductase (NADPH)